MKRLLKSLIGIILPLLLVGEISVAATVMTRTESSSDVKDREWNATNYYIKEIVILRSSVRESFSVPLLSGPLLSGWRTTEENKDSKWIENITTVTEPGINISYSGNPTVGNYSPSTYKISSFGTTRRGSWMNIESKNIENNDKPTLYGKQFLNVDSRVRDGRYRLESFVRVGSKVDNQTGTIVIRTLPTVNIEDIDFGDHPVDERINIVKSTNISISGGIPNEEFTLSIEGSDGSEGVNKGDKRYILRLKNPNTDEYIPVILSIRGLSDDPSLDSSGNASSTLKARINSMLPSTSGEYSGRAKIIFQYD